MRRVLVAGLLACTLLAATAPATATAPTAATASTAPTPDDGATPDVVAAYPNPVADGDAGEFVAVSVPAGVDPGAYDLTDGETTHSLANATAGTTIAVADDPRARNLTDHPVVLAPSLSLSNAGERLRVERNGTTVTERRYRDAPEGDVARWNGSRVRWRSLGATDRPVVTGGPGTVRAFVLPDAPGVAVDRLRDADDRILLAGYTLTSGRVAQALVDARSRNVTVRVLLEGEPVGGRISREARVLDRLVRAGVEVSVLGGPQARYDYHHAKYAVVDDAAVVLTENWKPAGTGGNGSRGWGVVTRQPRVVDGLAATFAADAGWRDARPWAAFREGRRFERGERAVGDYPDRVDPAAVRVERTELLVAPDNAERRLVRTVDGANESVAVIQASLGDWDSPLVRSLRRAARRGVTVRVLLSSAWYAREDNRRTVARFEEWADGRDAPLRAKLADPGGRYEKIHAKGAVVDDDRVVLGSLNWNERAATANREVILVMHGEAVADYYGGVFDADWSGGDPPVPVGLLGALAGCLVVAGLAARQLAFERPWGG